VRLLDLSYLAYSRQSALIRYKTAKTSAAAEEQLKTTRTMAAILKAN